MNKRLVLLDLDYTLIFPKYSKEEILKKLIRSLKRNISNKKIEQNIFLAEKIVEKIKKNFPQISRDIIEYLENLILISIFGLKVSPEEFKNRWDKLEKKIQKYYVLPEAKDFLEFLKKKNVKFYIVTESLRGKEKVRKIKEIRKANVIIAAEFKSSKDSPLFFKNLVKFLKAKPKEVLFVSDRESEIKAAKKAGINAVKIEKSKDFEKIKAQFLY